VKNERRQSNDNQPYGVWVERMLTHLYPADHPYHHPVIGSMQDLEAASLEDVRTFFRTYYVPNNAVLAIAGDIDVEKMAAFFWIGWEGAVLRAKLERSAKPLDIFTQGFFTGLQRA